MLLLLEKEKKVGGIIDHDFISHHTTGYEDFIADIQQANLDECVEQSGIPLSQIQAAADLLAHNEKIIICWAMGITQHANGVQNVQEIVNLLLLKGAIGKPGAGPCPVRGHSNVQGDRTMGIWEKMPDAFLDKLGASFGFDPPREHGYATVPAIQAMYEKKAKVFIGMGGNFVSATPDTDYTAKALRHCDLTVHVSTKPNRSHLVHGKEALILPTLGRSEIDFQESGYQFVSVENSMGIVHNSKGVLPPKSEHLKSEVAIICALAEATLKDRSDVNIDWMSLSRDYDLIRDKIEEVIAGFDNYNVRVRKGYGHGDRYRGVKSGREIIFMNQDDMKDRGFSAGEQIDVFSNYEGVERRVEAFAVVPYDIPRGCLGAYFPEANPLVPVHLVNPETHTPVSKSVVVRVKRSF